MNPRAQLTHYTVQTVGSESRDLSKTTEKPQRDQNLGLLTPIPGLLKLYTLPILLP